MSVKSRRACVSSGEEGQRGSKFEGLGDCASGGWRVERAEMNLRQMFTRDMLVLSCL